MEESSLAAQFAVLAAGVVAFAVVSRRTAPWPLTMPMVFAAFGLLCAVTGLVRLGVEPTATAVLAELALGVILFVDAARIDVRALARERGLPLRLLGLGLPLTLLLGAVVMWAVAPGLGLLGALLLAAILAPTDAALGLAVVEDPAVPQRVRQGLTVESGLNDGLVLPVVLFCLAALGGGDGAGEGPAYWAAFVLGQVGGGTLLGIGVGALGGWALARAARAGWVEGLWRQLGTLALAGLTLAAAETLGTNGFIAAFVAGLAVGVVSRRVGHTGDSAPTEYTEDTGQLLAVVAFFAFGNVLLAEFAVDLTWQVAVLALFSLTLMRLVPVAVSLLGSRARRATVLFVGWFGPRGLASILFGLLVLEAEVPASEELFSVVTWTVAASIVLHGASASWGAARYGRWYARVRRDMPAEQAAGMPEAGSAMAHRPRRGRAR
ncbi:cation:proton antiporter [Aquipuribacter nitratireducens]|uniref:Cation:proton antiporter n=1 Tax=Aquipuribacter nitratireducens TaxID=650104 RepID=A0ABW0GH31_9MICO